MSDTRRSLLPGMWSYRYPKGRKQALIRGARYGAIPPDPWKDLPVGKEAYTVFSAARRMVCAGFTEQDIEHRLARKWSNLSREQIMRVVEWTRKVAHPTSAEACGPTPFTYVGGGYGTATAPPSVPPSGVTSWVPSGEGSRHLCEKCGGTGRVKFCPCVEDKCEGCEDATCFDCHGTGKVTP